VTCSRNVAEPAALYLARETLSRFGEAPRYHNFPTFNGGKLSLWAMWQRMDGWMDRWMAG